MVPGYCVKCKEKGVELTAPEIVQTKTGGFMAKGKHEKCGTTVCAMMSKDNAEKAADEKEAAEVFTYLKAMGELEELATPPPAAPP